VAPDDVELAVGPAAQEGWEAHREDLAEALAA